MPRPNRIDYPGARHHVMNRSARRAPIFKVDEHCSVFLGILSELPDRFGVRVHAYALMPNHFHLLLESTRGNLSDAMKHLGSHYTRQVNRLHGWDGPVFNGRFRNRIVEDDAWWMHLLAYLHLNPVRAGLAPEPDQVVWSSHRAYCGLDPVPEWLVVDELLGFFTGVDAYRAYVRDLVIKRDTPPDGFDPEQLFAPHPSATTPVARPAIALVDPDTALAEIMMVTGTTLESLRSHSRGRPTNRAAWVAAWWLRSQTNLKQREIGALLNMKQTGVAQRLARIGKLRQDDAEVADWMRALKRIGSLRTEGSA